MDDRDHVAVKELRDNLDDLFRKAIFDGLKDHDKNSTAETTERHSLENALDVYAKLRQVPNFFSTLSKVTKTLIANADQNFSGFSWSQEFLEKFSIYCEEISTPQFLSLWEILLGGIGTLESEETTRGRDVATSLWIPLLSNLLMHSRLAEYAVPQRFVETSETLKDRTTTLIKYLLKLIVSSPLDPPTVRCIFTLCYTWGEFFVLSRQHYDRVEEEMQKAGRSASDLRLVHSYVSNKSTWKKLNEFVMESRDVLTIHLYCFLVTQKMKYYLQHHHVEIGNADEEQEMNGSEVLRESAEFLAMMLNQRLELICQNVTTVSDKEVEENFVIWKSFIQEIPFLIAFWSPEILHQIMNTLTSILINYHSRSSIIYSELVKCITADSFVECKLFQVSFASVILEKIAASFSKSKDDRAAILKLLTENFEMWLQDIDSNPKTQNANAEAWKNISQAGEHLSHMLTRTDSNGIKENDPSSLFVTLKLLKMIPLQNLTPATQTRIVYILLLTFKAVSENLDDNNNMYLKSWHLCAEILLTILSGFRSVWFLDFVDVCALVSWFISCTTRTLQKSSKLELFAAKQILKRLLLIIFHNDAVLTKFSAFTEEMKNMESHSLMHQNELHAYVLKSILEMTPQTQKRNRYQSSFNKLSKSCTKTVSTIIFQLFKNSDMSSVANNIRMPLFHAFVLNFNSCSKRPKRLEKWKKYFPKVFKAINNIENLDKEAATDYLYLYRDLLLHWNTLKTIDAFGNENVNLLSLWNQVKTVHAEIQNEFKSSTNVSNETDTSQDLATACATLQKENLNDVVEQIIANIFSHCAVEELNTILKGLSFPESVIIMSESELISTCSWYTYWQLIPYDKLSKEKVVMCRSYLQQLLSCVVQVICQSYMDDLNYLKHVTIPSINLLTHILSKGKKVINHSCIMICFQIFCQVSTFATLSDISLCCENLTALCETMHTLLAKHAETLATNVPVFFLGISGVLQVIVKKSDQTLLQNETEVYALLSLTQNLNRLFALMSSQTDTFRKIAPYLVSEYVYNIQQITILPIIKETLTRGIFEILNLCDEHGRNLLHSNLPQTKKELFKHLLYNHSKHYKIAGKNKQEQ